MSQITQVGFIDTTIYASDFITDNGTATVVGNEIEILGGTNITTDGAGNIVTVHLNDAIFWPDTNDSFTEGAIHIGNEVFMHNLNENTALGNDALINISTASNNTAIGDGSLIDLDTGTNNIALGVDSGLNYTSNESTNIVIGNTGTTAESNKIRIGTGQDEAFIAGLVHGANGFEADSGNVTLLATNAGATDGAINIGGQHIHMSSDNEIYIGNNAGVVGAGLYNTGIGFQNLQSLTTGNRNTTVGSSGGSLTSGSRNTLVGHAASQDLTTGTHNLILGHASGGDYTSSESNNILLQNRGVVGESNVMRLGTSGTANEQVNNTYVAGTYGRDVNSNPQVMIMSNDDKQGTMQSTQFRAELSSTQNNVTGTAGAIYKVPFNTKSFDGFGDYNTSTHEFTAPIDGLYYFEGNLSLDNVDSSADMVVLRFYVSGVEHRVERFNPSGLGLGPNNTLIVHGSLLLELTESDVAYLTIEVTGQSSNQVDVISSSNLRTWFSGYLVRPT